MTIEDNKALVARFVDEFWSSGNESAVDELMAEGVAIMVNNQTVEDPLALKSFARLLRGAFPDWHSEVEELVGEGDRVAERWTGHGTHVGEFQTIRATGRQVAVPGTVFYRIAAGRIVEFRGQFDRLSLLEQLGALPQTGRAEVPA
ncbi:MAG TPA: ester cyclase [Chloroflexota bacterium]|nr:ester cyclase [Chloroflexota bacterium]